MRKLVWAALAAGILSIAAAAIAAAHDDHGTDEWPTTCVDLNDIVEEHLGNKGNVGIYQNTFGGQAEAACQNDHRHDVTAVFGWAIATGTGVSGSDLELDWPTTCVELNDIVEGHLGNEGNVGIYQNTFGDQAEAACQNDHRNDVRSVFAWVIGGSDSAPAPTATEEPGASSPIPAANETDDVLAALQMLSIQPERREGYFRHAFRHWIDADRDGCDTRQEVLIEEAETGSITLHPSRRCRVTAGEWRSHYDDVRVTNPSDLDVDHLVPLAEAWDSGAWVWDDARREAFANDLDHPSSLIAVTASTNRSKGARDPAEWMPPNGNYACTYLAAWITVKARWGLSVDQTEYDFLAGQLAGPCQANH